MPNCRKWTDEEIEYITKNYREKTFQEMGDELGRSWSSIANKICKLKICTGFKDRTPIKQEDETYLIPLYTMQTKEIKYAIVDEESLDKIKDFNWYSCQRGNSNTLYALAKKDGKYYCMHNVIMNPPEGLEVDHINWNGLGNRKENLRICTHEQNIANTPKQKTFKNKEPLSKYKGVTRTTRSSTWSALINSKSLGSFKTEEEAARVYDKAAYALWGDFAYLNFPEEIDNEQEFDDGTQSVDVSPS